MYKIGFLVLHYKVYDMTCKCINSIYELNLPDCEIVITVVDNNSNDGSGEKLKETYKRDDFNVIILNEPYGFSEGNNIGYAAMKEEGYDFIFVTNNDIIFHQKDMLEKLIRAYEEKPFYMAGPDVFAPPLNKHQSPFKITPPTIKEMEKAIENEKRKLKKLPLEVVLRKIYLLVKNTHIYKAYHRRCLKNTPAEASIDWKAPQENVVLHGSCFIISKLFIKESNMLFTPVTKFYHEEFIMTTRLKRNGWNNMYLPQLEVTHMHGISSEKHNYYKNRKFRYTNYIASAEIYLNYLKEN